MKSIDKLEGIKDVEHLYIINIKQAEFDYLTKKYASRFEFIYFYNMKVSDLSGLSRLKNLKYLALVCNTKAERLWDVKENVSLHELYISDFPKLGTLEQLEGAESIRNLDLSGGIWNTLKVDSLKPLEKLKHLKVLSLQNIKVENGGIIPLSGLLNLEELILSNQFPTKEYALLSTKLITTDCEYFKPYVKLGQSIDDKDIMIIGKGKPLLNSIRDEERIKKYVKEFELLKKC